jgi:hypothetical protein
MMTDAIKAFVALAAIFGLFVAMPFFIVAFALNTLPV